MNLAAIGTDGIGTGLLLDLGIIGVTALLMMRGWRRGGVRALLSLLGLVLGAIAANHLAVLVLSPWIGDSVFRRLVGMGIALLLGALVGYAIGRGIGGALTRTWGGRADPPLLDRGLGVATYGVVGLFVCVLALGTFASGIAEDSMLVREISVRSESVTGALPGR